MNLPGPLVRVKSVEPLEKFRVRITFQNDVQKDSLSKPFTSPFVIREGVGFDRLSPNGGVLRFAS